MTNLIPLNRERLDPERNIFPSDFVAGIEKSDADFEKKKADYYRLIRALANCVYLARRITGGRLNDAGDFKEWLEDIAEMLR